MKLGANQTIELTGKRLKIWMIAAVLLVLIGVIMMFSAASVGEFGGSASSIGALVAAVGIILFIATKLRIWWYHR
jgi:ABC-type cobalt transport system substrate-binding protein